MVDLECFFYHITSFVSGFFQYVLGLNVNGPQLPRDNLTLGTNYGGIVMFFLLNKKYLTIECWPEQGGPYTTTFGTAIKKEYIMHDQVIVLPS